MIQSVQYLAIVVSLLSGGVGARDDSTPATIGRAPLHADSPRSRVGLIHAPAKLPAHPRPVILTLRELGIDEEDNDKLDAPTSPADPCGGMNRPSPSGLVSRICPRQVDRGGRIASAVLRC